MKTQRNYFQIIYNFFTICFGGLIAMLICHKQFSGYDYGKALFIIAVFSELFIYINSARNFYDVTLFVYLDRYIKILSKSFLVATVSLECIMLVMVQAKNLIIFSLVFLVTAYVLLVIGLIPGIWLQQMTRGRNSTRVAFVGTFCEFRKVNYYINKNSVRINQRGYILKDENDDDGTFRVLGLLDDLEKIIDENKLQVLYFIHKVELGNDRIEPERELASYINICKEKGVTVKILIDSEALAFSGNISAIGTYPQITIEP